MAIFLRRERYVLCRSQALASVFFKRNYCTLAQRDVDRSSDLPSVDASKWKKVSASVVGIKSGLISSSAWTVLKVLRHEGFEAYLVGGCVRDLILHRVPKDFDVITTANLKKIRKQFTRAQIVGKRFPICHVWIRGSMTEVSSFDTVAQINNGEDNNYLEIGKGTDGVTENAKENKRQTLPNMHCGSNEKDINRWRNSMQRDFTVNSLFFDPFDFKIYDYANGIEDLKARKLRTIIPAQLSFEEDCARILRGLRIAARLGLSFSKDIETAIPKCVSSVANLDPFRLTMEMNYMLSYGAAWPSIHLLRKFNLLQPLLPFQAAYLEQASKASQLNSTMLMKLFSNMDKLFSCDRPADCKLWIALLAFHTALVRDPQDALVVSAFGSVLYHGCWKDAVRYAREHKKSLTKFSPEVPHTSDNRSDADLAEAVGQFAFLLQHSVNVLTDIEDLQEALSLYPDSKRSGRVFIFENKGREVARAFDDLVINLESYESKREGPINYLSLGKGDPCEIRFVLGKIILDTMRERGIGQTDSVHSKGITKMQHVPPSTHGNDSSTLYNTFKRNQSLVHKHREHRPEALAPKPMQKASKWPRADYSTTKIHHVSAPYKEDNSTLPNQEAVASLASDRLKAERNVSSDNSVSKLLHKLVGISERMISKNKDHDPEASVLKPKQKTLKGPRPADSTEKTSKWLKQGENKNNQETAASLVSNLLNVERNASSDVSLGKLPHEPVGGSDRMVDKLKEHQPEASVPKPKRKTSKRPKSEDSPTRIRHVLATEKEDNDADNHRQTLVQKDTKQGTEAAVLGPKRKKSSKQLKQGEDKNNQEAVASPVSDLSKAEHDISSDVSLDMQLNKDTKQGAEAAVLGPKRKKTSKQLKQGKDKNNQAAVASPVNDLSEAEHDISSDVSLGMHLNKDTKQGMEAAVLRPKRKKTSKQLKQGKDKNNQEAVASPVSDLSKAEHNISSDVSLGMHLNKAVGGSDEMIKEPINDEESLKAKSRNQSWVHKHREHDSEASVPKQKQKASKRARADGSTAEIQHVLAADKEDDNANDHHQPEVLKDTKQDSEAAAVSKTKQRRTSKRLNQRKDKNQEAVASPVGDLLKADKEDNPEASSVSKLKPETARKQGPDDAMIRHALAPDDVDNHHQCRVQTDSKQGSEAAVPKPKRNKTSKGLKQGENKNNQEVVASPSGDNIVSSDDSVGRLETTVKEAISSEGQVLSSEKTQRPGNNNRPAAWKLSSLFK